MRRFVQRARAWSGAPSSLRRGAGCAVLLLAVAGAVGLAVGCKGAEETNPPEAEGAQAVQVTVRDFAIELPATMQPGPTEFTVRNAGPSVHNFAILGPDGATEVIEERLPEDLESGDKGTFRADLKPGQYRAWCPVADHADHGMMRKFVVAP